MPKNIKDILLLASVFITGAAVLIVEITAIRIFAPYYGNTLYTTSSVIGIVLAALSLGYYIGGILSDRYPKHSLFYGIIFISGLSVILIQLLNVTLLSYVGIVFSMTAGPLFFSVIIFFFPTFFLGTLSPFAIKLSHISNSLKQEKDGVGRQSGQIFFWSTLGSIIGSLLAGFILIPHLGIDIIILSTGIILSLWGFFGFYIFGSKNKKLLIIMVIFFLLLIFLNFIFYPKMQPNVIYEKDGVYEKIKITDGLWQGRQARFLSQDRSPSAASYLDDPNELLYEYTKYYELYKLIRPEAKSFFLIGGGAYSIPKALLKDQSDIKVDVAEIEPSLFSLAKKYFSLKDDARLTNYAEDGRQHLAKNGKKYDVIISDVYYSFFSIPIHFTTKEFFGLAKSRLEDNGVFIGNFVGDLKKESSSLIFSEINTFKSIFPNSYFFAVHSPKSEKPQNIIFLGINGKKQLDFKSDIILKSKNPIFNTLSQKNIDLADVGLLKFKEITDNFTPIEYLVSRIIHRWY